MLPSEVKDARRRLDLSVNEFARAVGVTGRTVRRWEAGSLPVPERVVDQIAAELAALLFVGAGLLLP